MVIFGVDPGTARMGWAVLETKKNKIIARKYGMITTNKDTAPENRLADIHANLKQLIKIHQPDIVSVEEIFFATNAKTAISVGQARGVILLTAAQLKVPVVSYSPLAVKRIVCGVGNADKKLVQKTITKILKLSEVPKPDDCADALAIATAHIYTLNGKNKIVMKPRKRTKKS